jgi:putative oxidoreductase
MPGGRRCHPKKMILTRDVLRYGCLPLLGRLLLSVIFVTSTISKFFGWDSNVQYMASKHLTYIPWLLGAALIIEGLGSLSLISGFGTRVAAGVLFLYLIPVTFLLHDFMSMQFEKNLGIMGGLLLLAAYGPGRFSLTRSDRNLTGMPSRVG